MKRNAKVSGDHRKYNSFDLIRDPIQWFKQIYKNQQLHNKTDDDLINFQRKCNSS